LAEIAINVKNKGAVLDGITDDTNSLIAAHDALPSRGGKILIPTDGKLKITSPITFTKMVILEGTSFSHLIGDSGSTILTSGSGELIFRGSSSGVRDLLIDGEVGNTGNGITMLCPRPWLNNVTVVNQGNNGIQIGSESETANVNSWFATNIHTKNNGKDGFYITNMSTSSPDANAGVLIGLDTGVNVGNGLTAKNCFDNEYIGIHSESNTGYGIQLINSSSNALFKPYLEANTAGDFRSDASSKYNYVFGHRRNQNASNFIFDTPENFIMGRTTKDSTLFPYFNKLLGGKVTITNEAISGYWDVEEDGTNRDLTFTLRGTSSNANIKFVHGSTGTITNIFDRLTIGGGTTILKHLSATATVNGANIAANSILEKTITETGAVVGDTVTATPNGLPEAGLIWSACVSAADTVTLRIANVATTSMFPANRVYRFDIWKH
jgi:hypothetical protein